MTMRISMTRLALAGCCCAGMFLGQPSAMAGSESDQRVRLRAASRDDQSDLRFKAVYRWKKTADGPKLRFKVKVSHGIPGELLAVSVNDMFIDWIFVEDDGHGKLRYRTDDMPDALPKLRAGDFITVGPIGGTFKDRDNSGSSRKSRMRLRGSADDGAGVSAKVKYDTRTRRERVRRRFKVQVEGAMRADEYDVLVNDELIGTFEIDEWGEGQLELRSRDADTEAFPTLREGDVVMVGDIAVTLALR